MFAAERQTDVSTPGIMVKLGRRGPSACTLAKMVLSKFLILAKFSL